MAMLKETHLLGSPFKGLHSADLIEEKRAALKGFLSEKGDLAADASSLRHDNATHSEAVVVQLHTRH